MKRYQLFLTYKMVIDAESEDELNDILSKMSCSFSHVESDGERIIDHEIIGDQFRKEI